MRTCRIGLACIVLSFLAWLRTSQEIYCYPVESHRILFFHYFRVPAPVPVTQQIEVGSVAKSHCFVLIRIGLRGSCLLFWIREGT